LDIRLISVVCESVVDHPGAPDRFTLSDKLLFETVGNLPSGDLRRARVFSDCDSQHEQATVQTQLVGDYTIQHTAQFASRQSDFHGSERDVLGNLASFNGHEPIPSVRVFVRLTVCVCRNHEHDRSAKW
jgi:hypothetical protein